MMLTRGNSGGGRGKAYRLDPAVRPTRYALEVRLDPARSRRFSGRVRIDLELGTSRRELELHAAEIRVTSARVLSEGQRPQKGRLTPRPARETVAVQLPNAVPAGEVTLELAFSGRLRDDLRGLYYARAGARSYAFTQLEATDARRFFPCFDEPAFKACFELTVVTAREHALVSNAPVARDVKLPNGMKRVEFEPTPLLSTYLVALAVGDLVASRVERAGKTPIRIWHVPGAEHLTRFAREVARETLTRLERYFGVPYAYGKLDLVAVPDFEIGAMENAGAVFFRETLLLVDEATITFGEKKRVAEVICHELAHMWYGNLVTMAWWDDLWLNEAFATWMAFVIVDQWRPELEMWRDFGHSRDAAMGLDALRHTHAIYTEVASAEQATENFDLITYEKGAAVLRMLERYLGAATFRRGVRIYIKRHREGNAVAADLWGALEEAAGQPVGRVVRTWIERAGFPLLRISLDGSTLSLSQERFRAAGPGDTPAERWPVPWVGRLGGAATQRELLTTRRRRINLPRAPRFVYGNAEEGGFYRPLHDGAAIEALLPALPRLAIDERMGLVGHQWALVHAGYAPLESFLSLLPHYADETDADVLLALGGPLSHLVEDVARAAGEPTLAALRGWIADVFGPSLDELGLEPARGEAEGTRRRRGELVGLVGFLGGRDDLRRFAGRATDAHLARGTPVEANLLAAVTVIAARDGRPSRHRAYLRASMRADTPQERRRYRMALADFRHPEAFDDTLAACLDGRIPTQDMVLLLARSLHNPVGRGRAWEFIERHWARLSRRMPSMLAGRLIEATPALRDRGLQRRVSAFFRAHPVPTAARTLQQVRERFDNDARFRRQAVPALRAWLG